MNLDQIKKDLEEFKAWQEKCRSLVLFDHPLDAYRPEDLIVKHLEELIYQFELLKIDTKIQDNFTKMNALADKSAADLLRNQLQKAEEVIRFYADIENHQTPSGKMGVLTEIVLDRGQKARKYLSKS